jgi:hypothetical protein
MWVVPQGTGEMNAVGIGGNQCAGPELNPDIVRSGVAAPPSRHRKSAAAAIRPLQGGAQLSDVAGSVHIRLPKKPARRSAFVSYSVTANVLQFFALLASVFHTRR